jgi:NitT/TauT family transport system permease protein
MPTINLTSRKDLKTLRLSLWDFSAFFTIFVLVFGVIVAAKSLSTPYQVGENIPISLALNHLPGYAWRSGLRMFLALIISLCLTFVFGTWAAKSPRAERIIIPMIDVLQAVPILGFLPVGVWFFIYMFQGSMLGPECASIFVIVTSQAWNMILSFYQKLTSVPHDYYEAAAIFHLSAWQKFWRIEVPWAMPALIWNMMLSLSAGWFFVVASEAISIAHQTILLPGIGSYIAVAIQQGSKWAIGYAIIAMLIDIIIFDQLLLRPLTYWSIRFKPLITEEDKKIHSWLVHSFLRARVLHAAINSLRTGLACLMQPGIAWLQRFSFRSATIKAVQRKRVRWHWLESCVGFIFIVGVAGFFFYACWHWLLQYITLHELFLVLYYGAVTGLRVMILVVLCGLIWVPVGVWIGLRPSFAARIQPVIQFLSALPVNLFYPLLFMLIVHYHLNVNIWSSPLIVLGMQWYILFNVIAGTMSLDADLQQAVASLRLTRFAKWYYFILPGILPDLMTGMITAAGGAWNASIVAEMVVWQGHILPATGLGAYIANASRLGQFEQLALGVMVMCIYVLLINRLVWQPLYRWIQRRFRG